jgi:hypothetical protein
LLMFIHQLLGGHALRKRQSRVQTPRLPRSPANEH